LAGLARFSGHGHRHGAAFRGHFIQYGLGEVLASTRCLDANIPSVHGVSHVCHGHLVGLVLGQQVGLHGVSGFLACLLSLAWLIWALTLKGQVGRVMSALAVLVLALSIWHWGPMWTQVEAQASSEATTLSTSSTQAPKPGQWDAWSTDKVNTALKEGRPVFVDFTAAWCVSCQFNKKVTFSNTRLLADFASRNVLLLRADWTRYDPQITAALNELGRNGVPVYAWYAPGQSVRLLSELPTVNEIQEVLGQLKTAAPK
jgi:thiol:disulfide interchange protein DsbD